MTGGFSSTGNIKGRSSPVCQVRGCRTFAVRLVTVGLRPFIHVCQAHRQEFATARHVDMIRMIDDALGKRYA